MADVTGGADALVVDIEVFEASVSQHSPKSNPSGDDGDGEELIWQRPLVHQDTIAAVDMEGFEDCIGYLSSSTSDDEGEEAHVSFKREDLNPNWVSSIKGRSLVEPKIFKASSASKSCSIHRVPDKLRKHNPKAYDPQLISIGPFHYKKRKGELGAMEEHKWRYLRDILSRKPESWLEDCLATLKRLEEKARDYYSEEGIIDNRLGNEDLVASHFNNMARGSMRYCDEFYLSDVCEKINLYSERSWPKLRASLVHDYFNNPWAIISFLAGVLFLLLAIGQTFFTSFPKFAFAN